MSDVKQRAVLSSRVQPVAPAPVSRASVLVSANGDTKDIDDGLSTSSSSPPSRDAVVRAILAEQLAVLKASDGQPAQGGKLFYADSGGTSIPIDHTTIAVSSGAVASICDIPLGSAEAPDTRLNDACRIKRVKVRGTFILTPGATSDTYTSYPTIKVFLSLDKMPLLTLLNVDNIVTYAAPTDPTQAGVTGPQWVVAASGPDTLPQLAIPNRQSFGRYHFMCEKLIDNWRVPTSNSSAATATSVLMYPSKNFELVHEFPGKGLLVNWMETATPGSQITNKIYFNAMTDTPAASIAAVRLGMQWTAEVWFHDIL